MKGYFITGTDTHIGKTFFACRYLKTLAEQGYSTAVLKPVSSGCIQTNAGLRNADALLLQAGASLQAPYEWINPFAFEPRISPNFAAEQIGQTLSVDRIVEGCQPLLALARSSKTDYVLIEGAGGWHCPLNEHETIADLAKALNFPIILVVGIRLGCLNHTLLTYQSLLNRKVEITGWVANVCVEDMHSIDENIHYLQERLDTPLLEKIQYTFRN